MQLCEKTAQTTNRVFFSRIEDAKDDGIQLKAPRFIKRHVSKVLAFRKDTESKNCRQRADQTLELVQERQSHSCWLYLGRRKTRNGLWERPGRRFLAPVPLGQSCQSLRCIS